MAVVVTLDAPRIGSPMFVEWQAGSVVLALVTVTGANPALTGWTASVYNDLASWACTVGSVTKAGNQYTIPITIPVGAPPELMGLSIDHATGPVDIDHAGCLSIVEDFDASFSYAHLTDEHMLKELSSDGWPKSAALSAAFSRVLSIINPRFVIHTGDNVEAGVPGVTDRYEWYLAAKRLCTAPCLWHPGSHERLSDWALGGLGPTYWQRQMGDVLIVGNDDSSAASKTASLAALTASYLPGSGITFRLLCQHFAGAGIPPLGLGSIEVADLAGCSPTTIADFIELMGHSHSNPYITKIPPNAFWGILAETAQDGTACIMPVDRSGGGWTLRQSILDTYLPYPNYTCLGGADVRLVDPSTGAEQVTLAFSGANDGSRENNVATITNLTSSTWTTGRVRFQMIKGQRYTVSGGRVIAEYGTAGAEVVLVEATIAACGTTTVSIGLTPVGEWRHGRVLQSRVSVT